MKCNACGFDNSSSAKYCEKCGALLAGNKAKLQKKGNKILLIGSIIAFAIILLIVVLSNNAKTLPYEQVISAINKGQYEDALHIFDENMVDIDAEQKREIEILLINIVEEVKVAYVDQSIDYKDAITILQKLRKWGLADVNDRIKTIEKEIIEISEGREDTQIQNQDEGQDFSEPQVIDPFDGLSCSFSGWNGMGEIHIDTSNCNQFVRDNFDFQLNGSESGLLSNGQSITICAVYDAESFASQNYTVASDNTYVEVAGLTELISASDFSEEKAWIRYSAEEDSYLACIDKKGAILFQYEGGLSLSASLYSNGYAHISDNNGNYYVVDSKGQLKSQYSPSTTGEVLAYGDGYTFTQKYISSFDESYMMYYIYDNTGTVIDEFWVSASYGAYSDDKADDAIRAVKYCGSDVFAIDIRYGTLTWYYFIGTKSWVTDWETGTMNCRFSDGLAFIDFSSSNKSMIFMEESGQVKQIALPKIEYMDWQWFQDCYVKEKACMLWSDFEPYMMCCDLETEEFFLLDDYYLERIDWDVLQSEMGFVNGHIAIPLKGDDKKAYMGLFDKQMNAIVDPMEYNEFVGFSDGRLILRQSNGTNVYDELGNLVYTLSEKDIYKIAPYSNNVALTSFFYYVDTNGDLLFTNIAIDNVKTLNINGE